MPKEIDCRGLSCPQPVVMTKKAIDAGETELIVLVDNPTAAGNVTRFAAQMGFKVEEEKSESDYRLTLFKEVLKTEPVEEKEKNAPFPSEAPRTNNTIIFINADALGRGSEELGRLLIKTFLHTVNDGSELPSKIIFMNSGVKLVTEDSESLDDLRSLEEKGVELLTCGTCLDYFDLKEKVAVSKVSNMYEILSSFLQAERVITL